jgi:hypothetical protein
VPSHVDLNEIRLEGSEAAQLLIDDVLDCAGEFGALSELVEVLAKDGRLNLSEAWIIDDLKIANRSQLVFFKPCLDEHCQRGRLRFLVALPVVREADLNLTD